MFTVALLTIAKTWKQVSVDRRMNKEIVVCIYSMEYYLAFKKEILPFMTTWMNLQNTLLSKISQTHKEKYSVILLLYGI